MFKMQFHSGFIPSDSRHLKFARHELDHLDTPDKYPEAFLGIAQPKPAQFSVEYDGIRIAGDQPENNLSEVAQLTETSSGSNCRRCIVETTDDLLGGAEWSSEQPAENLTGGITLLDFGEPSNFDLLVGDVSGSSQDLYGREKQNPFLGGVEDPVAPPQHEQQSNQNQCDLFSSSLGGSIPQDSSSSSSSSAAAAALLFDLFIPIQSAAVPTPAAAAAHVASNLSEKTTMISSSPQNQTKPSAEDDFLTSFIEIKPEDEDETSDDLLGQWNASNITTAAGPAMMIGPMPPRPCTSRSDLKSSVDLKMTDQTASVPHNNNSSSGMENLFGQAGQKMDPFRDLGNLARLKPGLGNGNSYQNKNMMKNASGSTLTNTGTSSSPTMMAAGVTSPIMGSGTPAWQPTPQHQTTPNYSAGPIPKVDEHTFEDLLERQKFMPAKKEPRTINEMRKTLDVKTTDPDTLKVRGWIDGKERNIRTLLCSLHTVLWTDEERWKEVGMHELISPDQVKKYYKKALLSVHPDRLLSGHPHKELARMIFIELHDAWTEFKETGMKPLYS